MLRLFLGMEALVEHQLLGRLEPTGLEILFLHQEMTLFLVIELALQELSHHPYL